jgi:hypothetical protein
MDRISLRNNIIAAVAALVRGRHDSAIKGTAEEGLAALTEGQDLLIASWNDAIEEHDIDLMLDAMMFYTAQELVQNDEGEPVARTSAETAMDKFKDASLALEAVRTEAYIAVEKAIPHSRNYRHGKYPRDAFHIACDSDRMRIMKGLTEFGHSQAMLEVAKARRALVDAAQNAYSELQGKILEKPAE